jgi:hypothetical protein
VRALAFLCLIFALITGAASAHEIRPAFVELKAHSELSFDMTLKLPALGGRPLKVALVMPEGCTVHQDSAQMLPGAQLIHGQINCATSPFDRKARLEGLQNTLTDALVRVIQPSGEVASLRLTPDEPDFVVPRPTSRLDVFRTYGGLGVEHILTGFDHLAFVAGLVLLVGSFRKLLGTITAFTLAHSLTLSAAALGFVHVPAAPVEALIALSILLVALEVVALSTGTAGPIAAHPARIAFTFGLLHGLGFASALAEVGLPPQEIPLSLLAFNVGVEAGQLIFILALLSALWCASRLLRLPRPQLLKVAGYGIGAFSALWLMERVWAVLAPGA